VTRRRRPSRTGERAPPRVGYNRDKNSGEPGDHTVGGKKSTRRDFQNLKGIRSDQESARGNFPLRESVEKKNERKRGGPKNSSKEGGKTIFVSRKRPKRGGQGKHQRVGPGRNWPKRQTWKEKKSEHPTSGLQGGNEKHLKRRTAQSGCSGT